MAMVLEPKAQAAMSNDMLELMSVVADPILLRLLAILILFVFIVNIKHRFLQE